MNDKSKYLEIAVHVRWMSYKVIHHGRLSLETVTGETGIVGL